MSQKNNDRQQEFIPRPEPALLFKKVYFNFLWLCAFIVSIVFIWIIGYVSFWIRDNGIMPAIAIFIEWCLYFALAVIALFFLVAGILKSIKWILHSLSNMVDSIRFEKIVESSPTLAVEQNNTQNRAIEAKKKSKKENHNRVVVIPTKEHDMDFEILNTQQYNKSEWDELLSKTVDDIRKSFPGITESWSDEYIQSIIDYRKTDDYKQGINKFNRRIEE